MTTGIRIDGITCNASIGVFDWEKLVRQQLHINLDLEALVPNARLSDKLEDTVNYKALTETLIKHCQSGHFGLLERLADELAQLVLATDERVVSVQLEVHKPGALGKAEDVAVQVDYQRNRVMIGVGSNIQPQQNIELAIEQLARTFGQLHSASRLITKAVARSDHPDFVNTAVLITTSLCEPVLTRRLKHLEYEMGRERGQSDPYAPRLIDLDPILWNDRIIDGDLYQRDFLQQLVEELAPGMLEHLHYLYHLPRLL